MTLGQLVAFFSLIWYIIGPIWSIGFHINNYTQSKASGERVLELLNQSIDVTDEAGALTLNADQVEGHVTFEHVTFAYGNKLPAVVDINLDAPPGSVIGILGERGQGSLPLFNYSCALIM